MIALLLVRRSRSRFSAAC